MVKLYCFRVRVGVILAVLVGNSKNVVGCVCVIQPGIYLISCGYVAFGG